MRPNPDNSSFVRFTLSRNAISVEGGNAMESSASFKSLSRGNLRITICRCCGVIKFFSNVSGCWNNHWISGGSERRYSVRFNSSNTLAHCNVCKNRGSHSNSGTSRQVKLVKQESSSRRDGSVKVLVIG